MSLTRMDEPPQTHHDHAKSIGFTLGGGHDVSLNTFIMTYIHHYIIQSIFTVLKISIWIFSTIVSWEGPQVFCSYWYMCQLSAWSDWNLLLFSLCLLRPSLLPGMDGFCILVKVCGFIFVVCVGCKWVWGEDSVSPGRSQCLCLVTQSSFGSLALLQKLNLSIGGAVESPHSQSCGLLRNDLCLPLTGEKLFSLVHFKFPNRREVPVWDKCRWLHRLPRN